MNEDDNVRVDPWLKKGGPDARLPKDARFACAYELFVSFENFDEAAFFRRTETIDELWIGEGGCSADRAGTTVARAARRPRTDGSSSTKVFGGQVFGGVEVDHVGCAYAVPREGTESKSCLGLLERLFRARVGFYWPTDFIAPGIITKAAYDALAARLKQEWQENEQAARQRETEIIAVARELGLCPHPAGTGPDHWYATCPRHSHVLFMNAAAGSFGCPWCKRKGGVEELRALVKERGQRATGEVDGKGAGRRWRWTKRVPWCGG